MAGKPQKGSQAGEMGIERFIGNIVDMLRPNLFLVEIAGYGGGSQAPGTFKFHCSAASLPASNIPNVEVPFMGRAIQIAGAGRPSFGTWNITIYNDIKFELRKFFEEWAANINSHEGNIGYNKIRDYYADADVLQLDQGGNIIANYTMKGIFPTSVGDIALQWQGGGNQIETFQVQLAVGTYWSNNRSDLG